MRKGFTLVELSIVLVIIGLLIGGILAGKSMITTAKVDRIVMDLQQYEAAINNFYSNYHYYPGDAPQFTPPGDGNGNYSSAGRCNGLYFSDEESQMWAQMSQAGMLKEKYTPFSPAECGGPQTAGVLYESNVNGPVIKETFSNSDSVLINMYSGYIDAKGGQYRPRLYNEYNFGLTFPVIAELAIPIETKIGVDKNPFDTKPLGLWNGASAGNCWCDNSLGDDICWLGRSLSCTDDLARLTVFTYYMAPQ